MEWLEITVEAYGEEEPELLCARLDTLGYTELLIEDEKDIAAFLEESGRFWDSIDGEFRASRKGVCRVRFYLQDDPEGRKAAESAAGTLRGFGYAVSERPVRDEDWENNWKQYYRPVYCGESFLIVPEWEEIPDAGGRTVLRLNPGLIFGTGSHPSTQMCLEATETLPLAEKRVLDLGCGSGILAIAALLRGAASATGCDIDPAAEHIAAENAALNGVEDRLRVLTGDLTENEALRRELGASYDLIYLNIVADVILALLPEVPGRLKPGGSLICSGIIDGREPEIESALDAAGLKIICHRRSGDWHSYHAIKESERS